MSRLLRISCVALVLVACLVLVQARAIHRAHSEKDGKPVDIHEWNKYQPTHNRRVPLPHDIMAPNGGAPWRGGDIFSTEGSVGARSIPTEPQADGPIANTQYGQVQGYLDDGVNTWRGVPFAAPPVGEFRWREPQDALNWTGVRQTYAQAEICPQLKIFDWLYLGNEDCLYADIYAPEGALEKGAEKLPVFVWIFGGAWVLGDGWEFGFYDGHNIAKGRNHVVVTFNYRLGPLGFMANDALRNDNPHGYAGNWALLDQVKALQWVQKNIANFGGDPTQVTIGGESAGGFSVCWHLASPLSKGLFHAAIMESGTCNDENFFVDYTDQRNWTNTYTAMVGCDPDAADVLKCLRDLPTGDIMGNILGSPFAPVHENVQSIRDVHADVVNSGTTWGWKPKLFPLMPWGATIDSVSLLRQPLAQIKTGNWNSVPVIGGTNNDEGTIFVPLMPLIVPGTHFPTEASDLPIAIDYFFNNASVTAAVEAQYPLSAYSSPEECFDDILRDFMFVCSTRRALREMDRQNQSTWLYHFWYKGDFIEDPILGDYHSSELDFVWDNQWPPFIHVFSQNDDIMAETIDTYWSNMVNFLNPNGNATRSRTGTLRGEEFWETYDEVNKADMVLAVPTQMEQDYFSKACDMWDNYEPGSNI